MEDIIQWLTSVPSNYIIIGFVALFYTLEQFLNTPFKFQNRPHHLFHNFLIQVVVYGVGVFFAIFQVSSIDWINKHDFGILNQIEVPFVLKAIVGVALFDFITYWCHRLTHKTPLLWRIHRVHHSDTSMDASTFFRIHPFEVAVFGTAQIIAAALFGLDIVILGLYFLLLTPFTIAQHSNIHFPIWFDKSFGKVFSTPNIHKVHHSQNQQYTDSNFADIFIIWDKLFGTYKHLPVNEIVYGLPEFDDEKKQTFWYLLKSPFLKIIRTTPKA
jgi:sterol desaturase/sphingolipid hydroxylase (fatty acid hydroxylase superfamily)